MAWRQPAYWAFVLSTALHGALAWGVKPEAGVVPQAAAAAPVFDLEPASTPQPASRVDRQNRPVTVGGLRSDSALDTPQAAGRGSADSLSGPGIIMFSLVSDVMLQDADYNNPQANQTQRIHTAPSRATLEQRRATPNPRAQVFLATGTRGVHERRRRARRIPAAGSLRSKDSPQTSAPAADEPRHHAAETTHEDLAENEPPIVQPRSAQADDSPPGSAVETRIGAGVASGSGEQPMAAARMALGRPAVDPGPAATPSAHQDPEVRDNRDTELLAARLIRSMVDASMTGGRFTGSRPPDGSLSDRRGLDDHGAGGGARTRPFMPGPGSQQALDTHHERYTLWLHDQKQRVQEALVFPLARALSMDQGTTLVRILVERSGRLAATPKLIRSSGFSDFDRAALAAIDRAAPFHPVPEDIAPDSARLSLLIPIVFFNPMVQ